jgi:hypothetical protein
MLGRLRSDISFGTVRFLIFGQEVSYPRLSDPNPLRDDILCLAGFIHRHDQRIAGNGENFIVKLARSV